MNDMKAFREGDIVRLENAASAHDADDVKRILQGLQASGDDSAALAEAAIRALDKATDRMLICSASRGFLSSEEDGRARLEAMEATCDSLCQAGASLSACGTGGRTPLHNAVLESYDLFVEYLLRRGVNPDVLDGQGCTALRVVAQRGSEEVTRRLLRAGADPNHMPHGQSLSIVEAVALSSQGQQTKWLVTAYGGKTSSGELLAPMEHAAARVRDDERLLELITQTEASQAWKFSSLRRFVQDDLARPNDDKSDLLALIDSAAAKATIAAALCHRGVSP